MYCHSVISISFFILIYNAGPREQLHLQLSTRAAETFGVDEPKIPKSQVLHYRKWLEIVANVPYINIATQMHLNTNNNILGLSVMYLGIPESRNDSIPLDQALKDPHRIDYVKQHLYWISKAIK